MLAIDFCVVTKFSLVSPKVKDKPFLSAFLLCFWFRFRECNREIQEEKALQEDNICELCLCTRLYSDYKSETKYFFGQH